MYIHEYVCIHLHTYGSINMLVHIYIFMHIYIYTFDNVRFAYPRRCVMYIYIYTFILTYLCDLNNFRVYMYLSILRC